MIEQDELKNNLIFFFKDRNYKISDNFSLKTNDVTIPFINATITPFKSKMSMGEYIEDMAHVQDCFRARYDTDFLFYFQMFGIEAMRTSLDKVMQDLVDVLAEVCHIRKDELYIVVNPEDTCLIDSWYKTGEEKDAVFYLNENIDKYHVKWKYGDEFPIVGNGLTISYNNKTLKKCSSTCDPFCTCSKYLPMGNVIIVTNLLNGKQYIDVGFGLEFLQAVKLEGDIFRIPEIKEKIKKLQYLGFGEKESQSLYNYFAGIKKLCSEDVKLENKGSGYVLKKMIRNTCNILLVHKAEDIFKTVEDIYEVIGIESETTRKIILNEMIKYGNNIQKGKKQAIKYYHKHKALDREILLQNMKETFGVPEFLLMVLLDQIK